MAILRYRNLRKSVCVGVILLLVVYGIFNRQQPTKDVSNKDENILEAQQALTDDRHPQYHEFNNGQQHCDADCSKLRHVLSTYKGSKAKAAIYYLTHHDRLSQLKSSLASLYDNFLKDFNYPVIIFHDRALSDEMKDELRKPANIQLFFQEISWTFPSFINASDVSYDIPCLSHISYRHMCRFQAKGIYEQPIMSGLEYVWRLDDDSMLRGSIEYDLFVKMRERRIRYGYIKIHLDAYDCTRGLWDATRTYITRKKIASQFFNAWPNPQIYYNNFEVSDMSVWMSAEYRDYINYIDRLGGIYFHRWGDAPIKSLAVSLFVHSNETFRFSDIAYQHGNFYTNATYSSF